MIKRHLKGTLSIVILIFVLFSCSNSHPKPWEITIADYLIKNHLTTNADSATIHNTIEALLKNTNWRGKLQINQHFNQKTVNCYIIDGDLGFIRNDDKLVKLVSNCSYAGSNIIFIDDAFLRSFLDKHKVVRFPDNAVLLGDQQSFLYWIIGHELGHLIGGHLSGHFESGSLDVLVANSSLKNKDELQADSFFVSSIVSDNTLRYSVQQLMMNILNAEIEQKVGKITTQGVGIIYDYTNQQVVKYAQQPTHPEYVIRLSRMLELSARMGGDIGLYNHVSGFIRQLEEVK